MPLGGGRGERSGKEGGVKGCCSSPPEKSFDYFGHTLTGTSKVVWTVKCTGGEERELYSNKSINNPPFRYDY